MFHNWIPLGTNTRNSDTALHFWERPQSQPAQRALPISIHGRFLQASINCQGEAVLTSPKSKPENNCAFTVRRCWFLGKFKYFDQKGGWKGVSICSVSTAYPPILSDQYPEVIPTQYFNKRTRGLARVLQPCPCWRCIRVYRFTCQMRGSCAKRPRA